MIEKTKKIKVNQTLRQNPGKIEYMNPEFVYFPLTNSRCSEGEWIVKAGDFVKMYEKIGTRKGPFFEQPILSSVSGYVIGFENKFHKSGKLVEVCKIENDMKYVQYDESERTDEEISKLELPDVVEIAKNFGLVGLGGSSFPTYIKLNTQEKINYIIVNGIECEPFISSDHRLIMNDASTLIDGCKLLYNLYKPKKVMIAIKGIYDDLYNGLIDYEKEYPFIEIKKVGSFYPQGWEIAMIKACTGISVQPGKLPATYGILNFNVATIVSIYNAVKFNRGISWRYVSVLGNAIKKPLLAKVRLGSSFLDILDMCGGYVDDADKELIIGGPMMGNTLVRDDFIFTKTVTSVIINNVSSQLERPCIRCASCVYSCPVSLKPVQIMKAYLSKDMDALRVLNIKSCIECGLCSYSCTSKISLTEYMRRAKKAVK